MSFALLIAAAWPTMVTSPAGAHPLAPLCRIPSAIPIAGPNVARVRPLGEEPPAKQIIAVLNVTPEGCVKPVVVRAEVGQHQH